MAGVSITGLAPAQYGGEWGNGSSWFLLNKSGEFSVDNDITATVYLVGNGHSGSSCSNWLIGSASSVPQTHGFKGGVGGKGGTVCSYSGLKIAAGDICSVNIDTTTALNISDNSYKSNDEGYIQRNGGSGSYTIVKIGYGCSVLPQTSRVQGTEGVLTPYGYVGSSGAGGEFRQLPYSNYNSRGKSATNYGGGGDGAPACIRRRSNFSSNYDVLKAHYCYPGSGRSGCVIVCLEGNSDFISVKKPHIERDFDYNGLEQTPNIVDFDEKSMAKTGTLSGTAVFEDGYDIYISLKEGCVWEDGTTDPLTLTWKINPIEVDKPTLDINLPEYDYDGSGAYNASYYKLPNIVGFNENIMDKSGEGLTRQYKAGEYPIVFSLKDPGSCTWTGGGVEDHIVTWKINAAMTVIPKVTSEDYIYDGQSHHAVVDGYKPEIMTANGHTGSYSNVGNYHITYSLRDPDSCTWEDGTTTDKTVYWNINKQIVELDIPYLAEDQQNFTYDSTTHMPVISNRNNSYMSISGTLSSVAAGNFIINVSLKSHTNYEYVWKTDDESKKKADIKLEWHVAKAVYDIPVFTPDNVDFNGKQRNTTLYSSSGEIKENVYSSATMLVSGNLYATAAGEYEVVYSFKDPNSAVWRDGTSGSKTAVWRINRKTVDAPEVTETEKFFQYDGNKAIVQKPTISEYDTYIVGLSGTASAATPNNYSFTLFLKDPKSSTWKDGTTADKPFSWSIAKQEVNIEQPYLEPAERTYNGLAQSVELKNAASPSDYFNQTVITYNSNELKGTAANDYPVTINLNLNNAYFVFKWMDGTTDPITLNWEMKKAEITQPSITPTVFKYDGITHKPIITGNNANIMTLLAESELSASAVGSYTIIYSLKDKNSAYWDDGTTDDARLNWKIVENDPIEIPTVDNTPFVYDGNLHTPDVSPYDRNIISASGDFSATNVGTYTITFSLKDPNSAYWSDGTVTPKSFVWVINKKTVKVQKPELINNEFVYNGLLITPKLTVTAHIVKTNDVTATKAGDYVLTAELEVNVNYEYLWEDGTTAPVDLPWRITVLKVKAPYIDKDVFYFTGKFYIKLSESSGYYQYSYHQPELFGYDPNIMNATGITQRKYSSHGVSGDHYTKYDNRYFGTQHWEPYKYYITVSFKDRESCKWEDGGNATYTFEWSIVREIKLLKKPFFVEADPTYVYDGTEKTPAVNNDVTAGASISGARSATAADDYYIRYDLYRKFTDSDIYDYRWEDNSIVPVILYWSITKNTSIKVPSLEPDKFDYNGTSQIPTLVGYDENTMTVSGHQRQIKADEYEVTFELKDPNSATWADGTTTAKISKWRINAVKIAKPTISPDYLEYDGEEHTVRFDGESDGHSFTVSGFDDNMMTYGGDVKKTDVGEYNVVISLKDPESCAWVGGSVDNIELPWEICKKIVLLDKPYLDCDFWTFDGAVHTPKIERWKTPGMYVKDGSDTSAMHVDKYLITLCLTEDKNITYLWGDAVENAVGGELELPWEIGGIDGGVDKPVVTGLSFQFDRNIHAPTIGEYDTAFVSQTGVVSEWRENEYTITFALKYPEDTKWSDGTVEPYAVKWDIWKPKQIVDVPKLEPEEFVFDNNSHYPKVTELDDVLTVKSNPSHIEPGDYEVVVGFNYDVVNSLITYTWGDGSVEDKKLPWRIAKNTDIEIPFISGDPFVYDGAGHSVDVNGLDEYYAEKIGYISGVEADTYTGAFKLRYPLYTTWTNGTVEDIPFSWVIEKAKLKKPTVIEGNFVYDGVAHSPKLDGYLDNLMAKSGDVSAVAANDYEITVSLKNKNSSMWEDGSVGDVHLPWKINKAKFEKPVVTGLEYDYDGTLHEPKITPYNENVISVFGVLSAVDVSVDADEYEIIFRLNDPNSACWIDDTTDDVVYKWKINPIKVEMPYLMKGTDVFDYNAGVHVPTLRGFKSAVMQDGYSDSVTSAVDVGVYHIYIGLRDPVNYRWEDGTNGRADLKWVIRRTPVDKPTLDPKSFVYDGKSHKPTVLGLRSIAMSIDSTKSQVRGTIVGDYQIVIKLNKNYRWSVDEVEGEDNIADCVLEWNITKITVPVPKVTELYYTYDGKVHAPKIEPYDINVITKSGVSSTYNAGKYTITFSLKDKAHCQWDTLSSEDVNVDWEIAKKVIPKPVARLTSFMYNGGYHSPIIDNLNETLMRFSGTKKETEANVYQYIVSLKDKNNYIYDDGTNDDIVFSWIISRKPVPVPYLLPDTFEYDKAYHSPEIVNFNSLIMSVGENSVRSNYEVSTNRIIIELGRWRYNADGQLVYHSNYEWETGGYGALTLWWYIIPKTLPYPTPIKDEYVYDGKYHYPLFAGYSSDIMGAVGTLGAFDAGEYQIGFTLKDLKHYRWAEGVVEGELYDWRIKKAPLDKTDLPWQDPINVYDTKTQRPSWKNWSIGKLDISGDTSGKNAGIYTAVFTPSKNYTWADGTSNGVEVEWVIEKRGLQDPMQINTPYYTGEVQYPIWNILSYNITFTGETSGIEVGEYDVECECDDNCYFMSTNSNRCSAYWKIFKHKLTAPKPRRVYVYTGEKIIPEFDNYDPELLDISGETYGIEIDTYIARFTIRDTERYMWAGIVIAAPKTGSVGVEWRIAAPIGGLDGQKKVPIPYQNNRLIYNGEKQQPRFAYYGELFNEDAEMIAKRGTFSAVNAGTYYVTFGLRTGDIWVDDTDEDKEVPWVIKKRQYPFPYVMTVTSSGGMYYYEIEGKRYPVWAEYDPDVMIMSGETYATDSEWHTTYFDLKDRNNNEWIDGTNSTYSVRWKLSDPYDPTKIPETILGRIHIPRQVNIPYEDGNAKYPQWDYFDNTAIIKVGGDWEGIEAGEYFVILKLRDGYVWEDETTEIKAVPWKILSLEGGNSEIDLISIHIPEQINIPKFDGLVKEPEWDDWDKYGIDIVSGDLYGVLAGQYPLVLRPQTEFIWEDGTVEEKTVVWVIDPGDKIVEIHDDPIPLDPEPETEETDDDSNKGYCGCCCCDTGLFDKLNASCSDDGEEI